ncbi:MAG TPA: hypothetical protein VFM38_00935 [Candidatus Limnocylindrales bacterium]|nr:hypothetical protein [Candidatus Limnocylindrales bacterium]
MTVTTESTAGKSDTGAQGEPSQRAKEIVDAARKADPASGRKDGADAGQPASLEGEVTITIGGVPRRVKATDLVASYEKREELEQLQKAVEAGWKGASNREALEKLHEAIAKASPQGKEKILRILQGESVDDDEAADDDETEGGEADLGEEIVADVAGAARKNGKGKPDPNDARLKRVEDALGQIVGVLQQQHAEKQTATRKQTTAEKLDAFPGLKDDKEAREFIGEFVEHALAVNPRAKLEDVVTKAAEKLERIRANAARSAFGEVVPESSRTPPRSLATPNGKPFGRDDLRNGNLRKAAAEAFRRLQ